MATQKKTLQKYIELLEVCNKPSVTRAIVKCAPDSVIKTICNAAINCFRGDVELSAHQRKVLKRFRHQIEKLCSKSIGLKSKRKILIQKGGVIWIPLLIGSVLGTFGTQLLQRLK